MVEKRQEAPARKRRLLLRRVGCSIIAGVLLTIVCWALGGARLWSISGARGRMRDDVRQLAWSREVGLCYQSIVVEPRPRPLGKDPTADNLSGQHWDIGHQRDTPASLDSAFDMDALGPGSVAWIWSTGFPLPCASSYVEHLMNPPVSIERFSTTLDLRPIRVLHLPLYPRPIGLAVDVAFWTGVWFGASLLAVYVRSRIRRHQGACAACGYVVGKLAICPECGAPNRVTLASTQSVAQRPNPV